LKVYQQIWQFKHRILSVDNTENIHSKLSIEIAWQNPHIDRNYEEEHGHGHGHRHIHRHRQSIDVVTNNAMDTDMNMDHAKDMEMYIDTGMAMDMNLENRHGLT
jgi:hypothetical protein